MKKFLVVFLVFIGLCLLLTGIQTAKIFFPIKRIKYSTARPFERFAENARLHFLVLGDSTAVGIGATPETSTSGWLYKDFPDSSIENISQNGLKVDGVRRKLDYLRREHYDAIIVQIGANDIIRATPYADIDHHLRHLIGALKKKSDHIIVLHSGDIGTSPMFVWPFSWALSDRSHKVREIYKAAARDQGFTYVDLIATDTDKICGKDTGRYYAADGLHLSGEGYHVWYGHIRAALLLSTKGDIIRHAIEG